MTDHKRKFIQSALAGLVAMSLSSCSGKPVVCTIPGVAKPMVVREGECASVAGTHQRPANPDEVNQLQPYDTYVRCYGVAASGKNDCGFKKGACAGTVKDARDPGAWVALPGTLCAAIPGGVIKPECPKKE